MPIYTDNTGLTYFFGADAGLPGKGGTVQSEDVNTIRMTFAASTIPATATVMDHYVVIGSGLLIEAVEVMSDVAATSGGAATLDMGLMRLDRTTELDYDGLIAALPLTSLNVAGEKTVLTAGLANAGALVGTTLVNAGVLTFRFNVAAFTAGSITIRVKTRRV